MPYVDPNSLHNPATGTSPPAAWGDNVRDNIVWLAGDAASGNSKPMCRVYHNAAQNVATATATALALNSERYDVGGMHSTSTNTSRITIPTGGGGVYDIKGCVSWNNTADRDGFRQAYIRLNGSTILAVTNTIGAVDFDDSNQMVSCDWRLSAGDYVELVVFQTSGSLLTIKSTSAFSPEFSCHWVGVG